MPTVEIKADSAADGQLLNKLLENYDTFVISWTSRKTISVYNSKWILTVQDKNAKQSSFWSISARSINSSEKNWWKQDESIKRCCFANSKKFDSLIDESERDLTKIWFISQKGLSIWKMYFVSGNNYFSIFICLVLSCGKTQIQIFTVMIRVIEFSFYF